MRGGLHALLLQRLFLLWFQLLFPPQFKIGGIVQNSRAKEGDAERLLDMEHLLLLILSSIAVSIAVPGG